MVIPHVGNKNNKKGDNMMKSLIVFLSVLVMSTFSTSLVYAVDMGEIKSAETRSGGIANQSQTDSFTFNGNIGQTIDISMSRQSGSVNPQIDLFDPSGILETSATCGDTAFCVATTIGNYKPLQSGLYTIVVRDNAMNGTGNYSLSLTKIPAFQVSPSILLSLNQAVFVTSDTLIVSARVRNGSDPVNVEAKTWISLPAGVLEVTILDSHLTFTVAANADVTADIFTYTFDGSEPSGNYNVGSRFLNIMSGRELSVNVQTFSFSP